MLVTSLLLAGTLGQAYPAPAPHDPPPCVVARVPGCREGYRLRYDAYGRRVYAYDPSLDPNAPQAVPPPPVYSPPAQAYQPPPQPYPPAQPYPAQPYPPAPPQPAYQPRGQFGLVWLPFGATTLRDSDQHKEWTNKYAGMVALQLRGQTGGAQFRLSGEYGPALRVAEIGLKYDFNEGGVIRPFLGVGIGGARLDNRLGFDDSWRAELSGALGIDLFLTQNFFLTGELKARGFARTDNDPSTAPNSGLGQVAAFAGAGIFF